MFQCVCQVYCQEVSWNSWKVIFAFVSSEKYLEVITMSILYKINHELTL